MDAEILKMIEHLSEYGYTEIWTGITDQNILKILSLMIAEI